MNSRKTDALVAVGALCAIIGGTHANLSWTGPLERPLDPAGTLLITVAALSLAYRRTAPLAAGAVAVAAAVVYYAAHYPGVFAAAPALASVYTLAMLGRRRAAIWLSVAMSLPVYALMALASEDPAAGNWMTLLSGWLVAMVVVGEVTRSRRAYLRAVEQRAEEAERTREEAALRRAGEERLWIAQELHDSLTHSISVVNVQVALALELLDRRPERVRPALEAIKESGHEAMRELRATLGVLRTGEADGADGAEAGLAGLPRLVSRAEGAGLRVAHTVSGEPYALPPEVGRAAYRIAQEALTNVLRHAGAGAVTVAVEYDPRKIILKVDNDGEPGTAPPGMGLIGMRERAVALGGSFTAGPGPHGGFTVRAELPVRAAA
ncbi:sensor histidine kinase [Nonomuraea terrae]|uniref:histidine kinase n=1 Tax=Nonomuraea terrae TaxID=2530383 RepID=A0A4R4XS35_9ACTN|nr:sensor histidine kinase [Nonomuraea terrae]TDD34096.1 sensor histidine kinase [Nonomuraea terrae]